MRISSEVKWHVSKTSTFTVLLSVHLYAPFVVFPVPYNYIGIQSQSIRILILLLVILLKDLNETKVKAGPMFNLWIK